VPTIHNLFNQQKKSGATVEERRFSAAFGGKMKGALAPEEISIPRSFHYE
jgi:hypothetical protein